MPTIIIDSHHPKDYLSLRQLGRRCRENGITVIWAGHIKDVLIDLMRQDGFNPVVITRSRDGLAGKLAELAIYDWRLFSLARRTRPFAMIGKSICLTHVGRMLGIPSILINDDSAAANPQYRYLGYPFATRILTAECLNEDYGQRQRKYPGLMELAYLHPNTFTPDPSIRSELQVAKDERLFVMRLAAFEAYHDVGQQGLGETLISEIVDRLSSSGRLFISSERPLTGRLSKFAMTIPASRLHHVLAECDLVVGDGLTVCVEAALLGVPAIVVGSYVGKHSYFTELKERFRLMWGFRPEQGEEVRQCIESVIRNRDLRKEWAKRRTEMLKIWRDPTEIYLEELRRFLPTADKWSVA